MYCGFNSISFEKCPVYNDLYYGQKFRIQFSIFPRVPNLYGLATFAILI